MLLWLAPPTIILRCLQISRMGAATSPPCRRAEFAHIAYTSCYRSNAVEHIAVGETFSTLFSVLIILHTTPQAACHYFTLLSRGLSRSAFKVSFLAPLTSAPRSRHTAGYIRCLSRQQQRTLAARFALFSSIRKTMMISDRLPRATSR